MTEPTINDKILAYVRSNPGSTPAQIEAGTSTGHVQCGGVLLRLGKAGHAYRVGTYAGCVWYATPLPSLFEMPPEYIKVSSIFRVGQRYAAQGAA
jgi:hypothetical protein